MKNFLFLLLLSASAFAQQKLTRYNSVPFRVLDTLLDSPQGVQVRLFPGLCYHYGEKDSVVVAPIYFVPKKKAGEGFQTTLIGLSMFFRGDLGTVKTLDARITMLFNVAGKEVETGLNAVYVGGEFSKDYDMTTAQLQVEELTSIRMAECVGTREFQLWLNSKVLVPKDPRKVTDYFLKADVFAESINN